MIVFYGYTVRYYTTLKAIFILQKYVFLLLKTRRMLRNSFKYKTTTKSFMFSVFFVNTFKCQPFIIHFETCVQKTLLFKNTYYIRILFIQTFRLYHKAKKCFILLLFALEGSLVLKKSSIPMNSSALRINEALKYLRIPVVLSKEQSKLSHHDVTLSKHTNN